MLDYFFVSFKKEKEKIGTLVLNASNWEIGLMKTLKEYLLNEDIKELDVNIKKYNVLTSKIENQIPKMEVT